MRHVAFFSVLPLVLSGQPLLAQAPGTPVPASLLKGRTLAVQHLGFSVDGPDAKWTWTQTTNPDLFHCSSPDGTKRFSLAVLAPDKPRPLDQAEADGYIAGFAESQQARGYKVENKRCTSWSGAPAGFRCSVLVKPGNQTAIYVAYIVSTTRFYSISYVGPGTGEPPEFIAFARSFKLIKH